MIIGVISDTHLKKATTEFMNLVKDRFEDCDLVVHAGDFTDPSVYFYLNRAMQGKLIAVCGNMDPPELRKQLPERIVFEKFGFKIGLIHGWGGPRDLEERIDRVFRDDGVCCIIYGHSHNSSNYRVDDILFFNPGSPTDRYFAKGTSIGYLTIQDDKISGEIVPI